MSFRDRIQQHERAGNRPQSVKIWRSASSNSERQKWHAELDTGEQLTALSCEGVTSAIIEVAGGEPVEVR